LKVVRLLGPVAVFALVAFQGCIYDPDARCGKDQHFEDGVCVCDPGMILGTDNTHCTKCGEHEFAGGTLCSCEEGYYRPSEGSPCVAVSDELGRECDPVDNPCTVEPYTYCHVPEKGTPYCTKQDCTTNEECGGKFGCEVRTSPTFCSLYPTGYGYPCTSDADCSSYETKHCETFRSNVCLMDGCAGPDVRCFGGSVCCDYSPLGVPTSICISPESLEDGKCPLSGTLIEE
jgi:hypothetical protein